MESVELSIQNDIISNRMESVELKNAELEMKISLGKPNSRLNYRRNNLLT